MTHIHLLAGHERVLEQWNMLPKDDQDVFLTEFIINIFRTETLRDPYMSEVEMAPIEGVVSLVVNQEIINKLTVSIMCRDTLVELDQRASLIRLPRELVHIHAEISELLGEIERVRVSAAESIPFCREFLTTVLLLVGYPEIDGVPIHISPSNVEQIQLGLGMIGKIEAILDPRGVNRRVLRIFNRLQSRSVLFGERT